MKNAPESSLAVTPARLDWRPTADALADLGRAYSAEFVAAMLALVAWKASLELKDMNIRAKRQFHDAERRLDALEKKQRPSKPYAKAVEKLRKIVAERENVLSCDRDKAGRQTPMGRARMSIVDATNAFKRHVEKHKFDKDMKAWARNGQEWRDRLVAIADRFHARVTHERAIEFQRKIAATADALLAAFEAPVDLDSRLMAISDLKSELAKARGNDQVSDDPGALDVILEAVANLRMAARRAADDYDPSVLATTPCESAWGRYVLDMQSFARANKLPYKVGASTPGKNDRYAPFAEFLWSIQGLMPPHLRYRKGKSTFVREAKEAVHAGRRSVASLNGTAASDAS